MLHHGARTFGLAMWIGSLLALPSLVQAETTVWGNIKTPTLTSAPQSIGAAANGCLDGGQTLAPEGEGYVSVRRYRNRYYGNPELIKFVTGLSRQFYASTGRYLMMGDLAQPRGGLMSSSHRSHQNGLDVDIWLTFVRSPEAGRQLMDNRNDPVSMVLPGGYATSAAWGTDQATLLKMISLNPVVDRLLVNPAIKQALCQQTSGDRSWLRKVRPWWGHDAHTHVRLKCPPSNTQCISQAPPPAGDGCDASLAWWFSREAATPSSAVNTSAKTKPSAPRGMPSICRQIFLK